MSFLIMCLAALGMVSYAISATVGLVLFALQRRIQRLAVAAQARLYFFSALAPITAAIAVLVAALAPSFGWIADHYSGELHSHPHICVDHPMAGWPAIPLTILATVVAGRIVLTAAYRIRALVLGWNTGRNLQQASYADRDGVRVLPVQAPQAFVLGLLRPTLYVTEGLYSGAASKHLDAVMAHERAHISRQDPLRRFAAGMGLQFHLPGLAPWIAGRHEAAQEMAADAQAAQLLESPEAVASALVALAKAKYQVPQAAFAAAGSDVEERVLQLMDERRRHDWPKRWTLLALAASVLLVVAIGADTVHHKVEFFLGMLGS